ncbi:MAG: riboflavin kinase [Armatimonadota bacterium]|nr:riboflavin kinase [Armatimonadota bacterium]
MPAGHAGAGPAYRGPPASIASGADLPTARRCRLLQAGQVLGQSAEVHLLDFPREELYGKAIEVLFIDRIRDEMKFESPKELVKQIERDIERAKELLKPHVGAL